MSSNREFDYHLGGIEDGIIELLSALLVSRPDGYVKTVGTYGGELDSKQLREALDDLLPNLPLMLVSYADGADVPSPATSPTRGEPFVIQHRCTFSVICASDDARGEKERRRGTAVTKGVYAMLADARRLVSGWHLQKPDGDEVVLLNTLPLTPSGVDFIARLPGLTAYAQHFDTTFSYLTPDRHVVVPGESVAVGAEPAEGSRPRVHQGPGVFTVT